MKYEDMSMSQLKSLCRDRGLGTGRSKQELIEKLETYDSRKTVEKIDDTDLTEEQIDKMMDKGDPVDLGPEVSISNTGSKLFCVSFPHTGPLLDSEHDDYRLRTRHLAHESGLTPTGRGLYSARLDQVKDGYLYYEIEVR